MTAALLGGLLPGADPAALAAKAAELRAVADALEVLAAALAGKALPRGGAAGGQTPSERLLRYLAAGPDPLPVADAARDLGFSPDHVRKMANRTPAWFTRPDPTTIGLTAAGRAAAGGGDSTASTPSA